MLNSSDCNELDAMVAINLDVFVFIKLLFDLLLSMILQPTVIGFVFVKYIKIVYKNNKITNSL